MVDRGGGHEAAHAVRDEHHLREAVLHLQRCEPAQQRSARGIEPHPRRVVREPRLKAVTIEVRGEVFEIAGMTAGAVDEEDGNLVGVVLVREIDAGTDLEHEFGRLPQAEVTVLVGEARIVDLGHRPEVHVR